jgi:adenylate cyclase
MGIGHRNLRYTQGGESGAGMQAVERALALNPHLAEAHATKAQLMLQDGDATGAAAEVASALALDPESYEVNRAGGRLNYQLRRYADAARFFEKAAKLMEADISSASLMGSCCAALGDAAGARRGAQLAAQRSEEVLAGDPNNSTVLGYSAYALAALGEAERAKGRMNRALLIDPDNFNMRYNFGCALCLSLKDKEAALEMLGPIFDVVTDNFMPYAKADPDLELLRDDPRYQAMVAAAEKRLAAIAGA